MKLVKVIIDATHIKTYEDAIVGKVSMWPREELTIVDEHTRETVAVFCFTNIVGYEIEEDLGSDEEVMKIP